MVEATGEERLEVVRRLQGVGKSVSSKHHYDERGSQLFEEITELDEYYLTRTERAILEERIPGLVSELQPATLIELGAGSARKSRVILEAMMESRNGATYVPVDVSGDFLHQTASALGSEYDSLDVHPVVADILDAFTLDEALPRSRWVALLGSTLGNFDEPLAVRLLSHVAAVLSPDDHFLLGADLRPGPRKAVARVEAAYNDARGVTARFSLNVLSVLNDTYGSDFDLNGFRHHSVYNEELGRMETSLVSLRDQAVHFPDEAPISLREGESIRSEISCKYDRKTIDHLFAEAGLVVERWMTDPDALYALILARVNAPDR